MKTGDAPPPALPSPPPSAISSFPRYFPAWSRMLSGFATGGDSGVAQRLLQGGQFAWLEGRLWPSAAGFTGAVGSDCQLSVTVTQSLAQGLAPVPPRLIQSPVVHWRPRFRAAQVPRAVQ